MSNDPNQSGNKRPPNSLAELGSQMMPSSISRTLESASPENTQRYQRLTEQIGRINEDPLYQLGQRNPLLLSHPDASRQYRSMESRRMSYMRQQEIMEEAAAQRANRMVGTSVNQSFASSAINGQISTRLESTGAQQESLRIASTMDPENVQRRLRMSENRMRRYGEEAGGLETVNKFGERDPAAETRLQQLYGMRELEIQRRTGLVGASRIHKMQGLDPESRMDSLVGMVNKAEGILGRENPDVKALGSLSAGDFKKREYEAADRLAKAFEKLSQETDTTSEQFKTLKKDVDEAEKQFKNVQTARGNGAGGGGGISGWALAQGGFNAAAMATQQIGVNQRLAQMSNVAGYANFQNEIYQTYKAANAGDVASLMTLSKFQDAENFGGELRSAANIAVIGRGAGGASQLGMGITEAGSTVNVVSDLLNTSGMVAAAKAGGQDIIAGGATLTEAGFDKYRDVSGSQANIAGRQANIAAVRALVANGAEQVQGFRDFSVGLSTAAMGMGGGAYAQNFLSATATGGQLERMAAARISPDQFSKLSQQGVNEMGGGFQFNQVYAARALERRGLGSMSENMGRMSQLYMAGANNPQEGLGKILEAAIPKGFDNSKLVGQLVQYSSQMAMSAGGAATGANLTGVSAALLTAGLGPETANKEALLQHAADIQGVFKGNETNISTSYAGMINVARTQKILGKGGIDAVIAGGVPVEQLMAIRDTKDAGARKDLLLKAGLSASTTPTQIQKLLEAKQLTELEAGGVGLTVANRAKGGEAGLASRIRAGTVSDNDKDVLRQIAGLESRQTGQTVTYQDILNRFQGISTKTGGGTGASAFSDKDVSNIQKSLDNLRTQGFVQLSTAAATAAKELDKVAGPGKGIWAVVDAFKALEKTIPGVEKNAAGAAANGAAGGKGFDTTQWDAAAKKLNIILDKIITKQGSHPTPSHKHKMSQ